MFDIFQFDLRNAIGSLHLLDEVMDIIYFVNWRCYFVILVLGYYGCVAGHAVQIVFFQVLVGDFSLG
jgi:hypothetical protein